MKCQIDGCEGEVVQVVGVNLLCNTHLHMSPDDLAKEEAVAITAEPPAPVEAPAKPDKSNKAQKSPANKGKG